MPKIYQTLVCIQEKGVRQLTGEHDGRVIPMDPATNGMGLRITVFRANMICATGDIRTPTNPGIAQQTAISSGAAFPSAQNRRLKFIQAQAGQRTKRAMLLAARKPEQSPINGAPITPRREQASFETDTMGIQWIIFYVLSGW
ncbi:MAG: hypothetical protein PVG51_09835 [Desulfosarcina sp.]|jgi:hypothetical protein